jgi:geranylgeranyl diphosphate synthase, type I
MFLFVNILNSIFNSSFIVNVLPQLVEFQKNFLPVLEAFFTEHRRKTQSLWSLAEDMFERLADFTLRGGKRTRPAILYYGYQGFSEENPERLFPICIACELMQSFLLIHDDIMDQSDVRRGGQTIHQQYQDGKTYYGESMAILVGNLAGYLGIRAIASSELDASVKSILMDLYSQICIDAGYGQALDISLNTPESMTEESIYRIYRYKTARYTTEFPLLAAAILGGCNHEITLLIRKLGVELGIIFQIRDDILGMFGNDIELGKQVSLDLIQGKKTLLIYKALEKSSPHQKEQLLKIYGNLNAEPHEIALAKEIIVETGAFDYANAMIEQRSSDALRTIEVLNLKESGEIFLKDFTYYCGHRNQ